MHHSSALKAYGLIAASVLIGSTAMTYFPIFLFFGPLKMIDFRLSTVDALIFDSLMCLLFFIQHSIMLRKSVKEKLYRFIPENFYPAVYSIMTGMFLWLVFGLWQTTSVRLYQLNGVLWFIIPILFVISISITMWASTSLSFYDPFGIKIQFMRLRNQELPDVSLTVKGPYRWVRHPLYLAALLIIWAASTLTADRLLFGLLWSIWIVVGTILEERDLRDEFGDAYEAYQRSVPMLIPYKIPSKL